MFDLSPRVLAGTESRSVGRAQAPGWRWIVTAIAALALGLAVVPVGLAAGQSPATGGVAAVAPTVPSAQHVADAVRAAIAAVSSAAPALPAPSAPTPPPAPTPPSPPGTQNGGNQAGAGGEPSASPGASDNAQGHGTSPAGVGAPAVAAGEAQPPASDGGHTAAAPTSDGSQQTAGPGQASSTSQSAGSSATTLQIAPVNVVVPIFIGSSGSVHVSNIASSNSSATSTSGTTQVIGGSHAGGVGTTAPGGLTGLADSLTHAISSLVSTTTNDVVVVMNWDWNWNWNWNWDPAALGWNDAPGSPSAHTRPAGHARSKTSPHGMYSQTDAATDGPGHLARDGEGSGASSSIVQIPAKSPLLPVVDGLPAPGPASGGGVSTFTLLLGAIAALLFEFLSVAGLLGRRLRLAGAGWQRQAYLAPPQRPG